MRRLAKWILLTLGIAALVRKLRSRGADTAPATASPEAPSQGTATDDPADELRRKLAETRGEEREEDGHAGGEAAPAGGEAAPAGDDSAATAEADPPAASEPETAPPDGSVEERRADVHEQARSALDEMRSSSGDE